MARILAVDDSRSIRELMAATLVDAGFECETADDGVDALNKCKTEMFELVITDLNMPNMDGLDLIVALRALPTYKNRPIVVVSTEAGRLKRKRARELGATGYIVKPFDPERLVNAAMRCCGDIQT